VTIIDAHHHVWKIAGRPPLPAGFGPKLERDFTIEEFAAELRACGIDGSVLVQSLNSFEETLEYLALADRHDLIRAVVGWVPLADSAACARALDQLRGRRKFVGMRHLIAYEPDPNWVLQPEVMASLRMFAERDLVFETVPINKAQLDAVLTAAERLPELKVNLNHLGRPPVPEGGWEPWASQMARAAKNPNVSVKLSAGGDLVIHWRWSTDGIRRYSDHVLSLFGADRVMAGSNWPVVLLGGSFAEVWHGIEELVAGLTPDERAAVMGGTAEKIFGF
jgi:L-fuconolactonase